MIDYLNTTYGSDSFARLGRYQYQAEHPIGGTQAALRYVTGKNPGQFYREFLADFRKKAATQREKALTPVRKTGSSTMIAFGNNFPHIPGEGDLTSSDLTLFDTEKRDYLLIVISLITFSIETVPGMDEQTYVFLRWIEVAIVLIFTSEYILRVSATEKKLSYILSFYGVIDLLSIMPFYISGGVSLQTLRVLRLIRLFRILKLVRYSEAPG